MAENENIGAVSVLIGGDYSPLIAAFGQAQGIAKQAGDAVASAFNSGAGNATGLVDQFGRSISSAGTETGKTSAETAALNAQIAALTARVNQLAAALATSGGAAHGAVSEIQAVGGAIRVLSGEQGIRAVERFITTIPGLGAALQAAFPLIGLAASAELIFRVASKLPELVANWTQVGIATQFAKDAAKDYADSIEETRRKLAAQNQVKNERQFGSTATQAINAGAASREAQTQQFAADLARREMEKAQADLNRLNAEIRSILAAVSKNAGERFARLSDLSAQAETATANVKALRAEMGRLENLAITVRGQSSQDAQGSLIGQKGDSEVASKSAASVQLAVIAANEKKNQEIQKADEEVVDLATKRERAIAQIQIDGIRSEEARTVAANAADVKMAEDRERQLLAIAIKANAGAKSSIRAALPLQQTGANADEQAKLKTEADAKEFAADQSLAQRGIELGDAVQAAKIKSYQDEATIKRKIDEGILESFSRIGEANEKLNQQLIEGARKWGEAQTRASEIQAKSQGDTDALKIEAQKLQLEQQYGLAIVHNGQQQVAYQKQVAELDAAARQAKIEGLVNAVLAVPDDGSPENIRKAAELQAELDRARAEANNANITANTKYLELLQQQSLQYQIQVDLRKALYQQVPQALGGALAQGIFDHGKGQKSIGDDIAKALAGVGKQIASEIFSQAISKLIVELVGDSLFTSTNTAATIANTAALAANTAAMGGAAAAGGASGASGPLGAIGGLMGKLVGWIGGIFGFADGGSPPVGVPSIVGERGPEIFVPKGAGTIIPNHMIKGYAEGAGLDLLPSISSRSSVMHTTEFSGDMHFHAHNVGSPQEHINMVARELPRFLKRNTSQFAPYSSN